MVQFGYVIYYVRSVENTLAFFEKTYNMKRRMLTEEKDYGELETGATVLAFASHELGGSNFPDGYLHATEGTTPLGVEVALVVDNVEEAHEKSLENGATELKTPEQKPWGQTVSYVTLPSGVLIELCTPVHAG
jgi:catechol 2,3-dioxygenase-like lactoylglutathione lyase family enzyme